MLPEKRSRQRMNLNRNVNPGLKNVNPRVKIVNPGVKNVNAGVKKGRRSKIRTYDIRQMQKK